ncbi:DNA cytosine methyltransferase [Amycolatopsis sp. OK19-0408]|uniref:DNA (cytosine-5-)-methyltransferase n=1 Tax=Amycolatopsis iheyensis TaxID=2945988 RepID=A0A9X2SNS8_9PSEU|nr:DNA cytosine methyltransferase [Amycolatopsis iheyensis]MCR6488318.1 DNA cytosine methyltransferase [Amycolatopsis iheyensis]
MSAPHRDDATPAADADDAAHFVATEGPVIGSLCTGLLGLDLAVAAVLGGRIAWYSEIDPHAERILTARLPGVPNLGDLRTIDFTGVEQVDVLTAGFPCQDISAAGRRAGIEKGTRSGLWRNVLDAVRVLRPSLVILENVAALRWRNGGLDHVLGGLAETRYDAVWRCVRASDIGAAHRRERVFVCAVPQPGGVADDADTAGPRRRAPRPGRPGAAPRGRAPGQPQRRGARGGEAVADAPRIGHRVTGQTRRPRVPPSSVAASAATGDTDGAGGTRGPGGRGVASARVCSGRHGAGAAHANRLGRPKLHTPHPRWRTIPSRSGTRTDDTRFDRRGDVLRDNTIPGGGGGIRSCLSPGAWGTAADTDCARRFFQRNLRCLTTRRSVPVGHLTPAAHAPGDRRDEGMPRATRLERRPDAAVSRRSRHPAPPTPRHAEGCD